MKVKEEEMKVKEEEMKVKEEEMKVKVEHVTYISLSHETGILCGTDGYQATMWGWATNTKNSEALLNAISGFAQILLDTYKYETNPIMLRAYNLADSAIEALCLEKNT